MTHDAHLDGVGADERPSHVPHRHDLPLRLVRLDDGPGAHQLERAPDASATRATDPAFRAGPARVRVLCHHEGGTIKVREGGRRTAYLAFRRARYIGTYTTVIEAMMAIDADNVDDFDERQVVDEAIDEIVAAVPESTRRSWLGLRRDPISDFAFEMRDVGVPLSRVDLARLYGVNRQTLANIEEGALARLRRPMAEYADRIADMDMRHEHPWDVISSMAEG